MTSNRIRLAVNGACGRMGHMVMQAALEDGGFEIVAAVESPECPLIGADAGTAVTRTVTRSNVALRNGERNISPLHCSSLRSRIAFSCTMSPLRYLNCYCKLGYPSGLQEG